MPQYDDVEQTHGAPEPLLSLRDIVEKFDAGVWAVRLKGISETIADATEEHEADEPLDADYLADTRPKLALIHKDAVASGFTATAPSLARLIDSFNEPWFNWGQLRDSMVDIRLRVCDDLGRRRFIMIDERHSALWTDRQPFGPEVAARYPSAADDIEEAAKCIALGRSTAAVFHLMRALEYGLHALGDLLDDPALEATTNRNWEAILRKCRAQVNMKPQERVQAWRDDPEFYAGVTDRLFAIKDAWRNPTMHVRAEGYTEAQAWDIWTSVGGFMRQLAGKSLGEQRSEPAQDGEEGDGLPF